MLDGRAISHVADEAGISRNRLGVWVKRYEAEGEAGLRDRSSRPVASPNQISEEIGNLIEHVRRETFWGPGRISGWLALEGISVSPATVHRELTRRGINRRKSIDPPTGEDAREVNRYEHLKPGDMLHIDVKKVGKIPDGGGWAIHGRGSEEALKSQRKGKKRGGYTFIHAAVDDNSRLAYAECHNDEKATTCVEFLERACVFFESHGIDIIRSVLTDNGSAYRSHLWRAAMKELGAKHRRTRPHTPRTNGKVERFNQTMKDEWLRNTAYNSEEERRAALVPFLNLYNHERPHSSLKNRPPISRAPVPGPRLTDQPLIVPVKENRDQLMLDL